MGGDVLHLRRQLGDKPAQHTTDQAGDRLFSSFGKTDGPIGQGA